MATFEDKLLTVKPFEFQKVGIEFILQHKYCILGDEQGLGKTLQAIGVMAAVRPRRTLIACPGILRGNWLKEVEKFCTRPFKAQAIYSGRDKIASDTEVLVVSYDLMKVVHHKFKPDMVIFDECQYLKNIKAVRTKLAHEAVFLAKPEYMLALSGTPITNGVHEFFSVLKLCSYCPSKSNGDELRERSMFEFAEKYTNVIVRNVPVRSRGGRSSSVQVTEYRGVKNIEALKQVLKGKYFRRLAKNQLDLPAITTKRVLLNMNSKLDEELFEAWNDWSKDREKSSHISRLKLEAAMAKAPHTSQYVQDLVEQGEKVVVFSDHVEPVKSMAEALRKKKIKVATIHGAINASERQRAVESFQGGDVQVLLCTIKTAATGITLTSAKNLVFNDLSWVPADIDQARKRIHRIGQTGRCVIHTMVMGETALLVKYLRNLSYSLTDLGSMCS